MDPGLIAAAVGGMADMMSSLYTGISNIIIAEKQEDIAEMQFIAATMPEYHDWFEEDYTVEIVFGFLAVAFVLLAFFVAKKSMR